MTVRHPSFHNYESPFIHVLNQITVLLVGSGSLKMPQLIDSQCIESIAKQMGLEFRRETNKAKYRAQVRKCKGVLDPDVVYLYDPGVPTYHGSSLTGNHGQSYDAALHYSGTMIPFRWDATSKVFIRKVLSRECGHGYHECTVCYENYSPLCQTCNGCGITVCASCQVKMCLVPENIDFLLSGHHGSDVRKVPVQCVQCRDIGVVDLRHLTYAVFDKFENFDERQQEALLFLKDSEPNFQTKLNDWKKKISANRKLKKTIKRFKKGCRVRTHGLKGARKWNGRIGKIIGERVVENDVIRWPVQLSGKSAKSQRKLLLKGVNMQKI